MYRREISYWLVPQEEEKVEIRKIMDELRDEYDAPFFEPHLTLYAGELSTEEAIATVNALWCMLVASGREEIALDVAGMGHSDIMQKTLYLNFALTEELSELSELCIRLAGRPADFSLFPHLSLMYKKLDERVREELASEVKLSFGSVRFNQIAAVSTPTGIATKEAVEAWEVVIRRELGA